MGVLTEVADQVTLELAIVVAQAREAVQVRIARAGQPAEHERRVGAATAGSLAVRLRDRIVELAPRADLDCLHALPLPNPRDDWFRGWDRGARANPSRMARRLEQLGVLVAVRRRAGTEEHQLVIPRRPQLVPCARRDHRAVAGGHIALRV